MKRLTLLIGIFLIGQVAAKTTFPYPFLLKCQGAQGVITKEKIIALTFDDGPNGQYTEEILATLDKYKIKATFFVIGKNIVKYRTELLKAYNAGHIIGTHSYSHLMMDKISENQFKEELDTGAESIYEVIGKYPTLFRPPFGRCTITSAKIVKNMGYNSITWSDMADDYKIDLTSAEKIANDIIELAKPGAIILLHDGGGNRTKTVQALPKIIEELTKKGYHFVTIPEMFNIEPYREQRYQS